MIFRTYVPIAMCHGRFRAIRTPLASEHGRTPMAGSRVNSSSPSNIEIQEMEDTNVKKEPTAANRRVFLRGAGR